MNLPENEKLTNWTVVYISGPLFFMSAEKLKQTLHQLTEHEGVIFSMREFPILMSLRLLSLMNFSDKLL